MIWQGVLKNCIAFFLIGFLFYLSMLEVNEHLTRLPNFHTATLICQVIITRIVNGKYV